MVTGEDKTKTQARNWIEGFMKWILRVEMVDIGCERVGQERENVKR